jgi:hypothetical protein
MKDAKGHGSNAKPIPGHAYHKLPNAQLRYIIKDASEAARATRGMTAYNPNSGKREDTEGKYLDQVNDASTVLGYRDRTGNGPDSAAAPSQAISEGHPKTEPVATHDAFANARRDASGNVISLHPAPTREERAKARAYKDTLR